MFFPKSYCSMCRLDSTSTQGSEEPSWALPHAGTLVCPVEGVGVTGSTAVAAVPNTEQGSSSRRARAQHAESGERAAAALWESRQNICDIWDRSRTRESEVDPGNLPITLMRMFPYRGRPLAHEPGKLARGMDAPSDLLLSQRVPCTRTLLSSP